MPYFGETRGAPSFLYWFGGLALLRDYLDYRYSWRFLYPLKRDTAEALDKWPLTWIPIQRPGHWLLSAVVFTAVAFGIAYGHHFWDLNQWVTACRAEKCGRRE